MKTLPVSVGMQIPSQVEFDPLFELPLPGSGVRVVSSSHVGASLQKWTWSFASNQTSQIAQHITHQTEMQKKRQVLEKKVDRQELLVYVQLLRDLKIEPDAMHSLSGLEALEQIALDSKKFFYYAEERIAQLTKHPFFHSDPSLLLRFRASKGLPLAISISLFKTIETQLEQADAFWAEAQSYFPSVGPKLLCSFLHEHASIYSSGLVPCPQDPDLFSTLQKLFQRIQIQEQIAKDLKGHIGLNTLSKNHQLVPCDALITRCLQAQEDLSVYLSRREEIHQLQRLHQHVQSQISLLRIASQISPSQRKNWMLQLAPVDQQLLHTQTSSWADALQAKKMQLHELQIKIETAQKRLRQQTDTSLVDALHGDLQRDAALACLLQRGDAKPLEAWIDQFHRQEVDYTTLCKRGGLTLEESRQEVLHVIEVKEGKVKPEALPEPSVYLLPSQDLLSSQFRWFSIRFSENLPASLREQLSREKETGELLSCLQKHLPLEADKEIMTLSYQNGKYVLDPKGPISVQVHAISFLTGSSGRFYQTCTSVLPGARGPREEERLKDTLFLKHLAVWVLEGRLKSFSQKQLEHLLACCKSICARWDFTKEEEPLFQQVYSWLKPSQMGKASAGWGGSLLYALERFLEHVKSINTLISTYF